MKSKNVAIVKKISDTVYSAHIKSEYVEKIRCIDGVDGVKNYGSSMLPDEYYIFLCPLYDVGETLAEIDKLNDCFINPYIKPEYDVVAVSYMMGIYVYCSLPFAVYLTHHLSYLTIDCDFPDGVTIGRVQISIPPNYKLQEIISFIENVALQQGYTVKK